MQGNVGFSLSRLSPSVGKPSTPSRSIRFSIYLGKTCLQLAYRKTITCPSLGPCTGSVTIAYRSRWLHLQGNAPVPPETPIRWPRALAGFLLGLFSVLWWQRRQDEALFRQMEADTTPPGH
jgi:hypothetical protein